MDFDRLFDFVNCKLMFKCMNGNAPYVTLSLFTQYLSQNRTSRFLPKKSSSKIQNSFSGCFLPGIWNAKPLTLEMLTNPSKFFGEIKKTILTHFPLEVSAYYYTKKFMSVGSFCVTFKFTHINRNFSKNFCTSRLVGSLVLQSPFHDVFPLTFL